MIPGFFNRVNYIILFLINRKRKKSHQTNKHQAFTSTQTHPKTWY